MNLKYEFLDDPSKRIGDSDFAQLMADAFDVTPDKFLGKYAIKHLKNPFGCSYAGLVFDGDKLVGMNFFLRWQFAKRNRILDAVQSCDTAIHPDYWGKGIFSKLQNLCMENIPPSIIRYGFPNSNSAPGFSKLGWTAVKNFRKSTYVLHPLSFFGRRLLPKDHDFVDELQHDNVFTKHAPLAERFLNRASEINTQWETNRSYALYEWKMSMNRSMNITSIRQGGEIVALICYDTAKLRRHPEYRLFAISDLAFEKKSIGLSELSNELHGLWRDLQIAECSRYTNLDRKKAGFYGQTFSRSATLIFHPDFGWPEDLTIDQFLQDSNVTIFDHDNG